MSLLTVTGLKKYFPMKGRAKKQVKAVDDISFTVEKGETLGLVGESGCGKSTAGRAILHLYPPTAGEVVFDGQTVTSANADSLRSRMQIVFQDPYSSLDPRMTVGDIVGEPLDIQKTYKSRREREACILEQLRLVGLNTDHLTRYPHEFSGGQRQRVSIARALAVKPEFIVCDEPVSALDVSIQAQVINTFIELQRKLSLTYLFIAHDLALVRHISNRVCVMYLGKLMEVCDADELYHHPCHPYTQALLSAIPPPDPTLARKSQRILLQGDVPSPVDPPSGCRFRTRCHKAQPVCAEEAPLLKDVAPAHTCACHFC